MGLFSRRRRRNSYGKKTSQFFARLFFLLPIEFLPEVFELHSCRNSFHYDIFPIHFLLDPIPNIRLEYNYDSKNSSEEKINKSEWNIRTERSAWEIFIRQPFSHWKNVFGLCSQSIRWRARRSSFTIAEQPSFSHEISKLNTHIRWIG